MTEDDVRRLLREHHAGVEPDALFAARVLARLPRNEGWSIGWAAGRVLPVTIALAMVLMIATAATGRLAGRTVAASSSSTTSATSAGGGDALDWLLEGREERR
jgi:hypothetical protein